MRFLLVVILLLLVAIVFFGYPPLMEQSADSCDAFEQRVEDLASHDSSGRLMVGALYGSSSSAPSGAAYVKDQYPMLPPTVGCTLAYWKTLFNPAVPATPAAPPQTASPEPLPPGEAEHPGSAVASTIARGITPNGDPILPATVFTLPMNSVAIRVDYPGSKPNAARFQLSQGRTVIAACNAEKSVPGIAWCQFNVGLRKGNYAISFIADNVLLGQFPFTVIGR